MKKLFFFISIILLGTNNTFAHTARAIVCVPVTDLIGYPLTAAGTALSYATLPLCGITPTQAASCPRLHQLIFNEQILAINPERIVMGNIQVQIPHLFFITQQNNTPQQTYWMRADHLRLLDDLEKEGIAATHFPPPIEINHKESLNQKKIVTLSRPLYCSATKQTYSAGTRFVQAGPATHATQPVYLFDSTNNKMLIMALPKQCYITPAKHLFNKKKQFVRLIQQWAHPKKGFIPYVFGGCSITYTSKAPTFNTSTLDALSTYAHLPDFNYTPKPGLDCSGLVARAAHLCGIPYFYKNTLTLAHYLPQLTEKQSLEAGDLIWIPGHVMVVSDLERNLLVEARSYNHGFGKVHEIALNNVFVGIETYNDLVTAYHKKTPLHRIDRSGIIRETFKECKLLRLITL